MALDGDVVEGAVGLAGVDVALELAQHAVAEEGHVDAVAAHVALEGEGAKCAMCRSLGIAISTHVVSIFNFARR